LVFCIFIHLKWLPLIKHEILGDDDLRLMENDRQ